MVSAQLRPATGAASEATDQGREDLRHGQGLHRDDNRSSLGETRRDIVISHKLGLERVRQWPYSRHRNGAY